MQDSKKKKQRLRQFKKFECVTSTRFHVMSLSHQVSSQAHSGNGSTLRSNIYSDHRETPPPPF